MWMIAKKAGITIGGIYNHFDSKEDIYEVAFITYHPYLDIYFQGVLAP